MVLHYIIYAALNSEFRDGNIFLVNILVYIKNRKFFSDQEGAGDVHVLQIAQQVSISQLIFFLDQNIRLLKLSVLKTVAY